MGESGEVTQTGQGKDFNAMSAQEKATYLLALLSACADGVACHNCQATRDQAQLAEIMVSLEEIKAWIERNQASRKEMQKMLEELQAMLQRGIEAMMSMLETVTQANAALTDDG